MEDTYYLIPDCIYEISMLFYIKKAMIISSCHVNFRKYYFAIHNLTFSSKNPHLSKFHNIKYSVASSTYDLYLMTHLTKLKRLNCVFCENTEHITHFSKLEWIHYYTKNIDNFISFSCLLYLHISSQNITFDLGLLQKLTYLYFSDSNVIVIQTKPKSLLKLKCFRGIISFHKKIDCIHTLKLYYFPDVIHLKYMKNLTSLRFLNDKLKWISSSKNLTSLLSLSYDVGFKNPLNEHVSNLNLLSRRNTTMFQKLTQLKYLKIIHHYRDDISYMKSFVYLEKLTCVIIQAKILEYMSLLKILHVEKIKDNHDVNLSTNMEKLKITNHDLHVNLKLNKLSKLTSLKLTLDHSEEFDELHRMSLNKLINLEILRVSFGVNLTCWYSILTKLNVLKAKYLVDEDCGKNLERMTSLKQIYFEKSNFLSLNLLGMIRLKNFKGNIGGELIISDEVKKYEK